MQYKDVFKEKRPWYGAKSLFYDSGSRVYEERIILLKAESYDDALDRAKREAEGYAQSLEDVQYAGYTDVFNLFDVGVTEGVEVYSLMRQSDLGTAEYIEKFIDTGSEVGIEREKI